MKLDNISLHQLFLEKDITILHHANTLATSITFLESNGLISRGGVEQHGLYQTEQGSDDSDKIFDVWNDIFIDTIDLHGYFPRQNVYGPISFKISIDFLLAENFDIWVTKNNPQYWNAAMTMEQKYFSSVDELRDTWNNYERQRKMITIKNVNEPILFDYLKQVLVDDPRVEIQGYHLFNEAVAALKHTLGDNTSLKNKFLIRPNCSVACYCRDNYLNQVNTNTLKRLFLPKHLLQ
jgi:hypothetical protein